MQWLLCVRLGEATPAFISVTSLIRTLGKRHKRRLGPEEPSSYLPSPLRHSFNFQGSGGEVAHCSGFWRVGFLNSDIHPGANPGKGSVSNYSSHPRTQCSASHILTISKTRETTPTSTEYFYIHGKTTHKMKGYKTVWS